MKYIFLFLIFLGAAAVGLSGWAPSKSEILTPSITSSIIINKPVVQKQQTTMANNEFMLEVITTKNLPFICSKINK